MASAETLIRRLKGDPHVVFAVVRAGTADGRTAVVLVADRPSDVLVGVMHGVRMLLDMHERTPTDLPADALAAFRTLSNLHDAIGGPMKFTYAGDADA